MALFQDNQGKPAPER